MAANNLNHGQFSPIALCPRRGAFQFPLQSSLLMLSSAFMSAHQRFPLYRSRRDMIKQETMKPGDNYPERQFSLAGIWRLGKRNFSSTARRKSVSWLHGFLLQTI